MRGLGLLLLASAASASIVALRTETQPLEKCPGYKASRIERSSSSSLTAHLELAGEPCNTYGEDLKDLRLKVEYQTDSRLHVMIYDADEEVYQVPEEVFPRPESSEALTMDMSDLKFSFETDPFSFTVSRRDTGEILFDTSGSNLVFQTQYLNLKTSLPDDPNLYGLGEHSDPLRLNTTDYTRTLWNRDSYGLPYGGNLYGSHAIYVDHRGEAGSHGVFMLNSNGMDIKINKTEKGDQYLEYNIIGGVIDLYFLAGPTPKEVAAQYAEVVGLPAMMPYWSFGFHQCRYGYRDVFDVAEVVYNYSVAGIPLETMWTDIDYMRGRNVFTLDPERFPIEKMRELVGHLHDHDQHYIVMVDPAVGHNDNPAFHRGVEQDIFMKVENGSLYKGAVWPGVTVYPDFFHPGTSDFWTNEFDIFFHRDIGVDIDGLWIDMNEAANFCDYPCEDPWKWERDNDLPPAPPPVRENPRPLPGFPDEFQPPESNPKRAAPVEKKKKMGLPGRDLINPPYMIDNDAGSLSNKTIFTDLVHANGLVEYDVHNLYGLMMSIASKEAMLARRPGKRPFVITRSTYPGAGAHVGKWLGDNLSQWDQYRFSIAQQLAYAAIFQFPMVGSDVCGFGGNVSENLCARWAMLGAFSTFYRNHNEIGKHSQEFYRWDTVADAARNAIEIRYRLLDYIYTAFHRQSQTGNPLLNPLFYIYPHDEKTFGIDLQFFYGDAILVSPVTEEDATSVDIYLPDDVFYDYYTGARVRGKGKTVTLDDIPFTHIPLHIRGGNIIPLRSEGANTTTALRTKSFEIVIAPDLKGKAEGTLYVDDGESIEQPAVLDIKFSYDNGFFKMEGKFDLEMMGEVKIAKITVLGQEKVSTLSVDGDESGKLVKEVDLSLNGPAEMQLN